MPSPDSLLIPIRPPNFAHLRQLLTEGNPASLVGCMNPGLAPYVPQPSTHPTHVQHPPKKCKASTFNPTPLSFAQSHTAPHNIKPRLATTAKSDAPRSYQTQPGITEPNTNIQAEDEA